MAFNIVVIQLYVIELYLSIIVNMILVFLSKNKFRTIVQINYTLLPDYLHGTEILEQSLRFVEN